VKAVIDSCFTFGFLVPVVDSFKERLAFVLYGKVDDARRAAVCGGDSARAEIVRSFGAAERQLQMRVWIDTAGDYEFSTCVDHVIGFHVESGADHRDALVLDEDVSVIIIDRRHNAAICYKRFHNYSYPQITQITQIQLKERIGVIRVICGLLFETCFGGGGIGGATSGLV
jgi:hypothetical protein